LKNSPAKLAAAQRGCGLMEGDSQMPDRLRSRFPFYSILTANEKRFKALLFWKEPDAAAKLFV